MDKSKKALEIIPHLILFIDTEELNTHGTAFSFVNRNEPFGKFGSWTWWFRCKRRRNLIACWLKMKTKRTFWHLFLVFLFLWNLLMCWCPLNSRQLFIFTRMIAKKLDTSFSILKSFIFQPWSTLYLCVKTSVYEDIQVLVKAEMSVAELSH